MTDQTRGDWMQSLTGQQIWMLDPRPEQIDMEEIATCLSRIPRFCGHTHAELLGYSVAQHSVLVSRLCGDTFALWGLLHDAHEAYLGDLSTPMKRTLRHLLGENEFDQAWCQIVDAFDGVIAATLIPGFEPSDELWFYAWDVKQADRVALATEQRDLMAKPPCEWEGTKGVEPADCRIEPLGERLARRAFIERYKELAA